MEVKELQRAYERCEQDVAGHWVEPELLELVLATARFVLETNLSQNELAQDVPDHAYIPLKACAQIVKVVGMRTYINWLSRRPDFARKCARKINGRWHYFPERVLEYIKNIPAYRNRLALINGN